MRGGQAIELERAVGVEVDVESKIVVEHPAARRRRLDGGHLDRLEAARAGQHAR